MNSGVHQSDMKEKSDIQVTCLLYGDDIGHIRMHPSI